MITFEMDRILKKINDTTLKSSVRIERLKEYHMPGLQHQIDHCIEFLKDILKTSKKNVNPYHTIGYLQGSIEHALSYFFDVNSKETSEMLAKEKESEYADDEKKPEKEQFEGEGDRAFVGKGD